MFNDLNKNKAGAGYRNDLSKEELLKLNRDERERRKLLKDQEKLSFVV